MGPRVATPRGAPRVPSLLGPPAAAEEALAAVIGGEEDQGAVRWTATPTNGIGGVSTRRVDELVQAMGLSGISKSTVSKLVPRTSTSAWARS